SPCHLVTFTSPPIITPVATNHAKGCNMKLRSTLLALAVLAAVGAVAVLGSRQEPADAKMVVAAQKFLASLDDKQKARITFDFDSKERTNWYFVPREDGKRNSIRK